MTSARITSKGTMLLLGLLLGLAMAFAAPVPAHAAETVPVYRLLNPYTSYHLLTTKAEEYELLGGTGWTKEGVAWQAPVSGKPVYRLFNPYTDNHLYTMDVNEYNSLPANGWEQESIEFFALDDGAYPVYRLSFHATNDHLLTLDVNEYNTLGDRGWNQEGIAFHVSGEGTPEAPAPGGNEGGDQGGSGNQGETTFPEPGTTVTGRHKTDCTYWVNRDGKFHLNTCRYVRDEWINSPDWFGTDSRDVAASAGVPACGVCNP